MSLEGLSYDDVLLRPEHGVLESREHASTTCSALDLRTPIIAAPMPSIASRALMRAMIVRGGQAVVHRINRTVEEQFDDYMAAYGMAWIAVGLHTDIEELIRLSNGQHMTLVLDIAHGDSEPAIRWVNETKEKYPRFKIVAGNVATENGARRLAHAGADAIKVGIGPGHACTTRQVTGFGVPQLQAIEEARWGTDLPIIADGGIKNSGDIAKAIAAGADAVMIGYLFAHTIEAKGDYYGAASAKANGHRAPEGIEVEVSDHGAETVEDVLKRLTWGLKSAISYAGGTTLDALRDCEFIRLASGAKAESKL